MESKKNSENKKKDVSTFGKLLLFFIVVVSIILMFSIFYYLEGWREENLPEQEREPEDIITSEMLACVELGCPGGTKYMGSSIGEVYHDCTSSQARSINKENRVCFSSADDAISKGYRT